jgi:hypothetical protein
MNQDISFLYIFCFIYMEITMNQIEKNSSHPGSGILYTTQILLIFIK